MFQYNHHRCTLVNCLQEVHYRFYKDALHKLTFIFTYILKQHRCLQGVWQLSTFNWASANTLRL